MFDFSLSSFVVPTLIVMGSLWFLCGFYSLDPQQSALLTFWGKPIGAKNTPGIKWRPLFFVGVRKISNAIQEFTFKEVVFTKQDVEVASSTATPSANADGSAPVVETTKQTAMASVTVEGVVQFSVMAGLDNLLNATFKLGDPKAMIKQRFQNALRGKMNTMTMWQALADKDQAAGAVKTDLDHVTPEFGHKIENISITNVTPADAIVAANNEMIASAAEMQTRANRGRGEQLETVAIAKGRADAKIEDGRGIAGQLLKVAEGRRDAVNVMKEALKDDPTGELSSIVLFTAYTDMMTRLGEGNKTKVIFADSGAGAPGNIMGQIRDGMLAAREATAAAAETGDGKTDGAAA